MKEIAIQNNPETYIASAGKITASEDNKNSFKQVLVDSINRVNGLQQEADHAVAELSAGNNRDIHQTMIALEKADVSFQLMMQVRNKIISAYEEIMRMQV